MEFYLSKKQGEYFKAYNSGNFKYLAFGGAFAGGKSIVISFIIAMAALKYPKTRYAIFRKNRTVLRRTTYITFKKVLELMGAVNQFVENYGDMRFEAKNGSVIYFLELDESKDHDFNKIKSLELTGAAIDQAEEVHQLGFEILKGRVGRENRINGKEINAFILLTCNPAHCWFEDQFYTPWAEGKLKPPYYFIQSLPQDNPWNLDEYIKSLGEMPENERKRYLEGDWNFSNDPNQLIPFEFITPILLESKSESNGMKVMGVDVARFGDDRTVFSIIEGNELTEIKVRKSQDTVTTGLETINLMREKSIGYENVGIDVIGLGAGVVDTCISQNFDVYAYNSGEAADNITGHFQFKNKRVESYWLLREAIRQKELFIVKSEHTPELIKELLQLKYFVRDKIIYLEPKEEMKKRLGKSPDLADSFAIAFFMLKHSSMGIRDVKNDTSTSSFLTDKF